MIEDTELKCKYISSFIYCDGGRYALRYVDDNYDRYVKTDKAEYGPYDGYIGDIKIAENGDCYYEVGSAILQRQEVGK